MDNRTVAAAAAAPHPAAAAVTVVRKKRNALFIPLSGVPAPTLPSCIIPAPPRPVPQPPADQRRRLRCCGAGPSAGQVAVCACVCTHTCVHKQCSVLRVTRTISSEDQRPTGDTPPRPAPPCPRVYTIILVLPVMFYSVP